MWTAGPSVESHAQSRDVILEKKTFELPSYTTVAGKTIKSVKIGWEAAGTLNADKSNAILITHYFSGTSHAFGKYAPDDKIASYWDAIIGTDKAIDTNKYYALSKRRLHWLTGTTKKSACVNRLTMGAAGDMRVQSRRSHAAEGDTMRKIAILAATAAVIAAAAGLWSTATFDKPKVAGHVQATEAPPVSPHEIMVKQGRILPVEYWADPF